MGKINVAVYMITYNHESYISQAIESIINQKTNFDFKLFIGEDCSTDRTREICLKYKVTYPQLIELILQEENIGAKANAMLTFDACFNYGDYVALCEGDDYWTDPYKLQKQVDFLEANPDFAICFHPVFELTENNSFSRETFNTSEKEEVYTIEDLARGNFIHTPSVVFRNGLLPDLPTWFKIIPVGDYPMHMLNAKKGKIKYLPDTMAVYRKHNGGVWSLANPQTKIEGWLEMLNYLMQELDDNIKGILLEQYLKRVMLLSEIMRNNVSDKILFLTIAKKLAYHDTLFDEWLGKFYDEFRYLKVKEPNTFYKALSSLLKHLSYKLGLNRV
jgi:glycosyltransferase involved in cell wall biosynthesis